MAKTPSNMIPLGTKAPDFKLKDVISNTFLTFYSEKNDYQASVVMFICNHCPFVKHVNNEIVRVANDYSTKNIRFFAINSNDIKNYPEDSPEKMKIVAQSENYPFPYLFDETQEVAKAYNAACTPDFFVFDKSDKLIYRGQLDDSRPGNDYPTDGKALRAALDCVIEGREITDTQKPSIGCNIKWK